MVVKAINSFFYVFDWKLSYMAFYVTESVDNLMAETHELGGSTIVVDRATPKASYRARLFILICLQKIPFFFF